MALVFKNDILYLHIPKTGGNWLTRIAGDEGLVLGEISHKHATFDYVCNPRRKERRLWRREGRARRYLSDTPRILCVVRNPLGWYESWFKYQTARGWLEWGGCGNTERWHVCAALNPYRSDDFMDFMRQVNAGTPGFVTQMFGRYTQGAGAAVLRNETLAADFARFADDVGLEIDRGRVLGAGRIGESPAMRLEWDRDVLAATVEREALAFRLYGYDLPET